MKIGAPLKSGKPHDGRAPDYDDWDLNGDLLFWNCLLYTSKPHWGFHCSASLHKREFIYKGEY